MAFTLQNARDDLLRKLGVEAAADASASQLADVATAINAALQAMQTSGGDFFLRQKLSVTVTANTASVAFGANVQQVLGPVRVAATGAPLRALSSRGEYDAFGPLYLGQASYTVAAGAPLAYFVECLRNADGGTPSEALAQAIWLVPKPTADTALEVEGIVQVPRYAGTDLPDSASPQNTYIPTPNEYTEAVFLPLARWALTRSNYFTRAELRAELKADNDAALAAVARAGGFPEAAGTEEKREVEA